MKKLVSFTLAAIAVMMIASCGNNVKNNEAEHEQVVAVKDTVIILDNDSLFRPDAKIGEVTVLDFNATWCIPCRKLAPAMELAAAEINNVKVYSVDIDSMPQTMAAFAVEQVPTVIVLSPKGSVDTYSSLEDFIQQEQVKNVSLDSATAIIYNSLKEKINKAQ